MDEENSQVDKGINITDHKSIWMSVTPFSKYLALTLFVALPFLGGWIGYTYSPEKIVEVEKIIIKASEEGTIVNTSDENITGTSNCDLYGTESYGGLTSNEKFECEKMWAAPNEYGYSRFSYYPEKLVLSGVYRKFIFDVTDDLFWFTTSALHFIPDNNELYKLPESNYIPDNGQINFRDNEAAESHFDIPPTLYDSNQDRFCTLSGRAVIEVSEMIVDNFEGGVPLSFRIEMALDRVVEKEPYKIECE